MSQINITVTGKPSVEEVARKLGNLKGQAPKVLRSAINSTAVQSRKMLAQEARQQYTVKNPGFNSAAKIQRATVGNLVATIRVGGKRLSVSRFHITRPRNQRKGAAGVTAEVISGGGLKEIHGTTGIKAFSGTVESGKSRTKQILQRQGASRYPLNVIHSLSVPKMLEMVYNGRGISASGLKREIQKLYNSNVNKQIARMMQK